MLSMANRASAGRCKSIPFPENKTAAQTLGRSNDKFPVLFSQRPADMFEMTEDLFFRDPDLCRYLKRRTRMAVKYTHDLVADGVMPLGRDHFSLSVPAHAARSAQRGGRIVRYANAGAPEAAIGYSFRSPIAVMHSSSRWHPA